MSHSRIIPTIVIAGVLAAAAVGPSGTPAKRGRGLSRLQAITASRIAARRYVKRHFGIALRIPDISSECSRTTGKGLKPWKCLIDANSGRCTGSLVVFGTPPDHVRSRDVRIACK